VVVMVVVVVVVVVAAVYDNITLFILVDPTTTFN